MNGLIPAIIQDADTAKVLMLGFSCVGRTPHTAYKFGWLGLSTWWLALRTGNEKPAPVRMVTAEQTQAVLCKYGKTE